MSSPTGATHPSSPHYLQHGVIASPGLAAARASRPCTTHCPARFQRTGGTDWKSAIEREHKKGIEDVLHIAEESKEEGLA
jgi:hypothetical protein